MSFPMKKAKAVPRLEDIELHPDAWERFERAARVVAKHAPMHRAPKPKPTKRRKRVTSGGT